MTSSGTWDMAIAGKVSWQRSTEAADIYVAGLCLEADDLHADILELSSRLVKSGLSYGADEIEVFSVFQRSMDVGIENNDVKLEKANMGSSVGIRVFKNRALGFACANTLNPERLDRALRNAISISKNSPRDDNNSLPSAKQSSPVDGTYDEEIEALDEGSILNRALRMLKAAKGVDDRIVVESARFEALIGEKALANSSGIEISERFTAIYYDLMAHAVEGSLVSAADYRMNGHRFLEEDDSERTSRELAGSLVRALHPKKLESFKGALILSPIASMELLVSPLLFSVDSNNVQKGISKFRGRLGQRVAPAFINISDDGTRPRGLSSSSFDREGVPHRRLAIIRNGELSAFLYNQYTANKDSIESTGHASGGPRSVPSIDATNISVEGGDRSLQDLVSSVTRGLLVQRFSGRVDPVSGDMSGVAKMSREIVSGSVGDMVRETMISGNVYDMMLGIDSISRDRERILDFELPYFKIENISITGG
ncbi:MAG: TldD/PmbA family protein [Thermoplasmata archaeon]